MTSKIIQYCPERKAIDLNQIIEAEFEYSLKVFDKTTILFFSKLSRLLLSDKTYNRHPEIASLGFWLREANMKGMQEENKAWLNASQFSVNPAGLVFHVAPSNVDTIFLYSACISLLMGNRNIVRISSTRQSAIILFIMDCINKILNDNEFQKLKQYFKVITYEHNDDINGFFSSKANCRVIWGGDNTVAHFKSIQGAINARDVVFPNRVSYSVFDAKAFTDENEETQKSVAHNFFNDAYTFDQLGCSSPRIIYVLGSNKDKEKFIKVFYDLLSQLTQNRYHEQASALSTQKFNHLIDDVVGNNKMEVTNGNNAVYLVETGGGISNLEACLGGYFYIKHIKEISEISKDVNQTTQTLTYFGVNDENLNKLNESLFGKRIDRIVPVGQALAFHYIWDGMNLFEELARKRYLKI